MNTLWFGVAVFGCYRIAYMVAYEEGPVSVFARLRARSLRGPGWIKRGVSCPLCVSFWVSWAVAYLLPWARWQEYGLLALGIAGGVLVVHRWLDRS